MKYYIPMSSPKKSDYKDNQIRKSIVPIVRVVSSEEVDNVPVLKETLRISKLFAFCLQKIRKHIQNKY